MLLGFEFPNEPRDLTVDEWSKVDALGSRACKMRPYNLTAANLAGIRERGLAVLLRSNSDGDIDVEGRVRELSRAAWTLREHGIGDIWIIPDNEPNLHHRPVPPDYWQRLSQVVVGLWYGHFGTRALASTVSYLNPPLAVGQGEETWYEAAGSVLNAADGQCLHAYGQLDTGLIGRALMLAKQYTAGIPLIADEVGDSHGTANWDLRGEALRVYLQLLRQSGVRIAILFILGGTDDWANFVPPIDVVRRLAASMPQEVTMPIPTIIEAVSRPVAQQGGQVAFTFDATGIDGIAKGFADVAYPIIPGSQSEERYGPNLTTELPVFGNGRHTVTLNVPAVATATPGPVVGGITLRIVEMDGVSWDGGVFGPYPVEMDGVSWDGGVFGPYPVDLVPGFVQPPVVTPEPPAPSEPSTDEHLAHSQANIHFGAGDAYNRTQNPIYLDIQRAVAAAKAGQSFSWPQRP